MASSSRRSQQARLLKKALIFAVTGSILTLSIYGYFKADFFTITTVDIVADTDKDYSSLQQPIKDILSQSYQGVIRADKILTFPYSRIQKLCEDNVEGFETISIYPTSHDTLHVAITHHKPLILLDDDKILSDKGVTYSLETSPDLPILYIARELPSLPVIRELRTFADNISAVIFPVTSIIIDDANDVSLYNKDMTSVIHVPLGDSYQKTWRTLLSAADTNPLKEKLETNLAGLEYIDIRFGNKVFYKFTDVGEARIIDSHATTTPQTIPE